jgi:hypothetical protein
VSVSTNGLLTFGGANTAFTNSNLSFSPAQAAIAVLWDDLFVDTQPFGIYVSTTGSAGNRQFIVQWNQVRQLGDVPRFSFQAILSEGSNSIRLNYGNSVNTTVISSATVGIKAAGTSNPDRLC